jgi:hypothetical protein
MTKRELIDEIVALNHTASPQFLARFQDSELDEYLGHLRVLTRPRLSGNAERYEKYFRNCPTAQPARPLWRTDSERIEQILANAPRDAAAAEPAEAAAAAEQQAPQAQTACAVVEDPFAWEPPRPDQIVSMSVSPAEREQLLAELDEAAADIEDYPEQDDQAAEVPVEQAIECMEAEQAETDEQAKPQDYVPQEDDADLDDGEEEDGDFLAEDEDRDGLTDYAVNCDSHAEQAPATDYIPVRAEAEVPAEPVGVAPADAGDLQPKGKKDESENWLF